MIYIDIDKEAIPYSFDVEVAGEIFEFVVKYNSRFDYFTLDLYKDGEAIIYGEKIIYGRMLFSTSDDPRLPTVPITPFDEAGVEDRITYENLNESVFLFVGDPDE